MAVADEYRRFLTRRAGLALCLKAGQPESCWSTSPFLVTDRLDDRWPLAMAVGVDACRTGRYRAVTKSDSKQRGNIGTSAVSLKFERDLFWGTADNSRDDRGIDFFALARDSLLGMREIPIGIQVKTGKSRFDRAKRQADGDIEGWWYESSKQRFKYWEEYGVPVLLVLHNEDDDVSFWVHVTQDAYESTGTRAKILVPRRQTISKLCKDQLLRIADRHSASLALEGTVLADSLEGVPSERRMRYALVVPRFIAPPPHVARERPIDACEAVALLAQGDLRVLDEIVDKHDEVPRPESLNADASWDWQFTAAIWDWLVSQSIDKLKNIYETAPEGHSAAASGVLLACALGRRERHEDAVAVLYGLIRRGDPDALDRAWVLAQRARWHADLGNFDAAQSDAADARRLLDGVHNDALVSAPMVSALLASATRTMNVIAATRRFRDRSSDAESTDLWIAEQQKAYLELLKASDTTVSWWRARNVASALGRAQDANFESWVEDNPPQYVGGSPMPETKLLAAEFNADITGEHGSWRTLSARRGVQNLLRAASLPDTARELGEGLDTVRRSGDSNRFTKATHHLLRTGPLAAVAASVRKVPTAGWTHTTAKTNFDALALAGDLIDQSVADQLLEQCARAACGETTALGCIQDDGYFSLPAFATEAAAGVLPAASASSHDSFTGYLAKLPEVEPGFFLRGLERALSFLDYTQIGQENRRGLLALSERGHAQLSAAVWGWFASHGDSAAIRSLIRAAAQGDIYALAEIEDPSVFNESESAALMDTLAQRVDQAHADALTGAGSSWNSAFCHALTRLNLTIPSSARWEPVITLLGEPRSFVEDKAAICRALGTDAQQIPEDVRDQLAALVDVAASASASFWPGAEAAGIEIRLKIALALVDESETDRALVRLALGSHQERRDACLILRSSACASRRLLLEFLYRDANFTVRYQAAQTVAHLVATEASDADIDLAWKVVRDDGRHLPIALLQGFAAAPGVPAPIAQEISNSFEHHPSAIVRHHAAQLQQLSSAEPH